MIRRGVWPYAPTWNGALETKGLDSLSQEKDRDEYDL